jgi:hypothetical protein
MMTYAQIAALEGISPSRAHQIGERALAKFALRLAQLIRGDIERTDPKCISRVGSASSQLSQSSSAELPATLPDSETAMQLSGEIPHRPKWR